MNRKKILEVHNLTTKIVINNRKIKVVDDVSFEIEEGKTSALVGETGCGKSMLALSIMRILPETIAVQPEGEIIYKGKNLLALPEKQMRKIRGGKIAMIFQDPMTALNPVYTIEDQMREVVELHLNLFGNLAEQKILQALSDVEMPDPSRVLDAYSHQLSGGMQQRVMIAMALLCEPDLLIADEPTTALDVTIQKQILELIRHLQKKKNMALLLITHDMGVVAEIADEVMIMYATEVVEKGTINQIFSNMSHHYTKGLFKSRPHNTTKTGKLYNISGSVPPIDQLPEGCRFYPRCPNAQAKCRNHHPNFKTISKEHDVACFFPC